MIVTVHVVILQLQIKFSNPESTELSVFLVLYG